MPFTPRSKQALELALRQARDLGHDYIGTEHILLGLLAVSDGLACRILFDLGVTASTARDAILSRLAAGGWTPPRRSRWRRMMPLNTPVAILQPIGPASPARSRRLLHDVELVLGENDTLRAEVDRLHKILEEHQIDPGESSSGNLTA